MNCPRCNAAVPDGAKHCPRCQNLLRHGTAVAAGTAVPPPMASPPAGFFRENRESRFVLGSLFRRYWDFRGRSSRREFWLAFALWLGMAVPASCIGGILGLAFDDAEAFLSGFFLVWGAYTLATLIPGLAVLVRRLHDTGHSGKTAWLFFTGICAQWVVYALCCPSQSGTNIWGGFPVLPSPPPCSPFAVPPAARHRTVLAVAARGLVRLASDAKKTRHQKGNPTP